MCIELIKDIASIVTPIITIGIAFLGLQTWRKKLWGENKFTLSLDTIRELFLLKEEIRKYRNPMYSAGEIYQAYKKICETNPEEKYDQNKAAIFVENIRWNSLVDQNGKYENALIKLKIVINEYKIDYVDDENIMTFLKKINGMRAIKEMHSKKENYLEFMDEHQRKSYLEQDEKALYILNYMGPDDEFDKKIEEYFYEINRRIRKYL